MRRRNIAAALLLAAYLLCLSACRASPALVQVVYNQESGDVDHSTDEVMRENSPENTEQAEDIFSVTQVEESESERGFENSIAQWGEAENPEESAADSDYDSAAGDQYTTPQGVGDATQEDSAGGDSDAQRTEDGSVAAEDGGVTALTVEGAGSGAAVYKQVVLPDGTYLDVPSGLGSAAATGEAAILVQMLGGSGALVATSADFLENTFAQTVFADEGAADIPAFWSGDGSAPLSDEAFARLLALSPGVCFELSGQMTFTESQIAALGEAGIEYVVLPSLASASGIRSAVSVVGTALGDRSAAGGLDAAAQAEAYLAWHDALLSGLAERVDRFTVNSIDYDNVEGAEIRYLSGESDAADGRYTLYLSAWDSEVLYRISTVSYVELEEYGLPVTEKGYCSRPLNYYMSMAGVVNKGAAALANTRVSRWYVHPIRSVAHIKTVLNGAEGVNFNNTNGSQTKFLTEDLGAETYPAVVVASREIKEALQNCTVWQRGTWIDSHNDILKVQSTIVGEYEIYVNPYGVGSWADGSAESVLESVWAAQIFHGAYTQEELEQTVREFYSSFYRYDLSAAEIAAILSGELYMGN
ncbi:MAG: hypothetical protein LUG25_05020 [Oscillospiraceae bacterium]|nr:hypothetical protein [Oscillospiraceae bacterium]